jgi:hypothetical protein
LPVVRRNVIPLLIFASLLLGGVGAYAVYLHSIGPRIKATDAVLVSPSDVKLSLTIAYDAGPLTLERWNMRDLNGVSTTQYHAVGRNGVAISIAERASTELDNGGNVAYLFGQLVQDGIWKLTNKPPRGNTNAHYTVTVYQLIDGQHGSRTIEFTDPHYWATTGGHQFTIHLDKNKPVPDLVQMSSTTLVDPAYENVVKDFRTFGPPSFLARVTSEKKRRYGVSAS